jgi:hypothetical protein
VKLPDKERFEMKTLRKLWANFRKSFGLMLQPSWKAHLLAFPTDMQFERAPAQPRDVDLT